MSKNRHLLKMANCFLELRNDDDMTDEEKHHIADTIDGLLIALIVNLSDCGSKEEYKTEILKRIEWYRIEDEA